MRVLLLNQAFYPDVVSTAQYAHDLAKYLVGKDHQVVVVASRSIYGQKGGAPLPKHEMVDGIEVHRVGISLFGKSSIFLRILDFVLFYLQATVKTFMVRRPDVLINFTTPPFIALTGYLMKLIKGVGYVYWLMDLYPDLPVACGVIKPGSLIARSFEAINRFCMRKADRVVVLGRCMSERVLAKGIPAEKLKLINVWSDSREVAPVERSRNRYRKEWGLGDAFVVMYSGNFGLGHDVETFCRAARIVADCDNIRFVFVGGGKRMYEVEQFVASHRMGNVQIHPYQPRSQLDESLSLGDLHLISLKESVSGIMVPSKLYGIMAAARPAVFIGNPGSEIARTLIENDCGRVVRCGDAETLADLIKTFAQDPDLCREMGQRARQAVLKHYNLGQACAGWEKLLLDVTGNNNGVTPYPKEP